MSRSGERERAECAFHGVVGPGLSHGLEEVVGMDEADGVSGRGWRCNPRLVRGSSCRLRRGRRAGHVRARPGTPLWAFVLGGFVASTSSRTLTLEPPVPGGRRDWAGRAGETVTLAFSRAPLPVVVATSPIPEPTTQTDSFMEWLSETTPGGPVVAQMLITLLVYAGVLWKTPPTPLGRDGRGARGGPHAMDPHVLGVRFHDGRLGRRGERRPGRFRLQDVRPAGRGLAAGWRARRRPLATRLSGRWGCSIPWPSGDRPLYAQACGRASKAARG